MSCPFFTFLLACFGVIVLLLIGITFPGFWIIALIIIVFIILGKKIEKNLERTE